MAKCNRRFVRDALLAAAVVCACGLALATSPTDSSKPPLPPSAVDAADAAPSDNGLSEVELEKLDLLRKRQAQPGAAEQAPAPRVVHSSGPWQPSPPHPLGDRDPCDYVVLEQQGGYASWANHDFFALPYYTYYWTLVAVTADSGDIDPDLKHWRTWNSGGVFPDCVSDFVEGSQAGGTYVDFIVGDFNHNPSTTTYPEAFAYSGSGKYVIVSDAGSDIIPVEGATIHRDVGDYYVGEIWDVYLVGGFEYAFDFEATSPFMRMSLFASNGSEYWASRGGGVWDVAGDTRWTPPVSDWYGLVVYADHQATGSFDLRVGLPCEQTPLVSGSPQSASDGEYWSFDQTYPCWSAIGISRSSGTGNPDLYVYKSWDEGAATPGCVDTLLCNCTMPAEDTDFIVGNFHWEDLGTYYAETSWEYGGGTYTIDWDGYGESAPTDGTPISMAMGPTDIVRVWDVYLEAGREYTFHFSPTGTDLRLSLVEPYEHWTPRWLAAWETTGDRVWTPLLSDWYGLVVFNEGGGSGSFDLSIITPCTYEHLPEGTSLGGDWDPEFYRFTQLEQGWTVVATRATNPQYSDADIQVYGSWIAGGNHPHCATGFLAGSGLPAWSVDFVAGNCWESPLGTYFVKADWFSGWGLYWIQWENGADYLPWSTPIHRDVSDEYLAEVWDVILAEGQPYVFDIYPDGADVRMALFRSEPGALWKGRSQAEWMDVTDRITWVPPESGTYGLVAYNEDGGTGSFAMVYGHPCSSTELAEGVTYHHSDDTKFYRVAQSNERWAVVATRWTEAPGNADLYAGTLWDAGGVSPYCLGDLVTASARPGTGVDLIVTDFHHTTPAAYHTAVLWDSPTMIYGIQWDGDDEVLELETRVIERVVDVDYIAEIWDVYLEAGHEYTFYFDPRGTELHMALFRLAGAPYWAPLDAAVWDATGDVAWTAPATDWYGLVVYNEGGGSGSFSLGTADTPVESSFFADLTAPATIRVRWSVPPETAGTGLNLYRSTGVDAEYERLNEEPGGLPVFGTHEDGDLWPGTEYWYDLRAVRGDGSEASTPGSPVAVRTDDLAMPALLSAGPNPVVGEAVIRYHVPNAGDRVSLKVVNAAGKVVRTILDDAVPGRGTHAVAWDGRSDAGAHVASGIYFYRLTVGSWEAQGKLTVIR